MERGSRSALEREGEFQVEGCLGRGHGRLVFRTQVACTIMQQLAIGREPPVGYYTRQEKRAQALCPLTPYPLTPCRLPPGDRRAGGRRSLGGSRLSSPATSDHTLRAGGG